MFSDRVKHARKQCGLSRKQVAEYVELSESAVVAWESGKNEANNDVYPKLAEILNVSVSWLRGESNDPQQPEGVFLSFVSRDLGRLEGLAASRNKTLQEFLIESIARSLIDRREVSSSSTRPASIEEAFSILTEQGAKESFQKPPTDGPSGEASGQTRT